MSLSRPAPSVSLSKVVLGLDGSQAALEAGRQIVRVAGPDAEVWAVSCWDPATAMHAGIHAGAVSRDLRRQSLAALDEATRELRPAGSILVRGAEVAGLLSVAQEKHADLVAVGAGGLHGALGMVMGSVASAMCRHAPCSVLLARPLPSSHERGPIVLASDGSVGAMVAASAAAQIAARESLKLIVACVGDEMSCSSAAETADDVEVEERLLAGDPVDAITKLARDEKASLILVGARGRRGIPALGSVSRRVAEAAPCSTLIVRTRSYPVPDDE